ncbi:MAG: hypothetical protein ACKVS8_05020 [Phycisphaerales bacterium]
MSSLAASGPPSYPVGRSSHTCAATGRALVEGEPVMAALVEHKTDGHLERLDFTLAAWESGSRPTTDSWLVGTWKTTASSGPKRRPILDDEAMLELVEQLEHADDKSKALRLVLALMLVQRRILVQVKQQGTTLILRKRGLPLPPDGPEPLHVEDPGMDEAMLAEVAAELEALTGGLPEVQGADAPGSAA